MDLRYLRKYGPGGLFNKPKRKKRKKETCCRIYRNSNLYILPNGRFFSAKNRAIAYAKQHKFTRIRVVHKKKR